MGRYLPLLWIGGLGLLAASLMGVAASGPVAPEAARPTWGRDIQVNPTGTPVIDIQKNIALAVNPGNPNQILASYDTIDPRLTSYSGYAWSTDAGRTWAPGLLYGSWITSTDSLPQGFGTVAFDKQGTAYYAGLATGNTASGYFVLTATVGSAWSTPVPVAISSYDQYRDRGALVIDQRSSGLYASSLYLGWRYFSYRPEGVWLRYSRDRGRTWSGDVRVSDTSAPNTSGPSMAVASDGTVYAAFAQLAAQTASLYLDRSTDGGQTWGSDRLIGGAPVPAIGALDWEEYALVLIGDQFGGGLLISTVPAIAVAPTAPDTVYATWNDGRWDTQFEFAQHLGQHGDIAFSRSTDGGLTWSAPLRVNDDALANGADQFQPAIAVGPNGVIGLSWYDRRDDPEGFLYHQYYSQSEDGGQTWSANQRISDQPSNPTAVRSSKGEGYLGEYHGLRYGPDYVLTTWLDTQAGAVQDVYADWAAFLPGGSPTASPAPPPLATASPVPSASPVPCAPLFSDVPPDHPFYPYVTWASCRGIVSGYACGGPGEPCDPQQHPYFRPAASTTRGQLSKMVVLGLGWTLAQPPDPTFADVPPGQPFYPFIETAAAHGVISGYGCGGPGEPCDGQNHPYFRPGATLTRGQLGKIIVNALGWSDPLPAVPSFADVPGDQPFYPYIEQARTHAVISGYGCGGPGEPCDPANRPYFRPAHPASRAQLSKILNNALTAP